MGDDVVFSHRAAAALHGLPSLNGWPPYVEVTTSRASGGRSSGRVRRHAGDVRWQEIVEIDGVLCTSVSRTVVDIARTSPFADAVCMADAALHRKRRPTLLSVDELRTQADLRLGEYAFRRVERVVAFATPLSDSVLESRSRVTIHELGFPTPILQQRWTDAQGIIGDTDFWWPEFRLCGEADGLVKYLDRELRRGRSPGQVLVDEKRREDRIRACGPRMTRWISSELDPPQTLGRKLLAAGLLMGRP
ncbi:hypothetical protein [Glaciibacter flavus]|uniref:hypothetical protein n=1 Tax=Orlajensenia flava TaxID=2565934 RepID=UPI003AFFD527